MCVREEETNRLEDCIVIGAEALKHEVVLLK